MAAYNHEITKNGRSIFLREGVDSASDKTKVICPSCRRCNSFGRVSSWPEDRSPIDVGHTPGQKVGIKHVIHPLINAACAEVQSFGAI
jgi:hypothetical protein